MLLRRMGAFFLIFIIVFLMCEAWVRQLVSLGHMPQTSYIVLDTKLRIARQPYAADKNGILLLGDSLMNMAVYPELLSHRLNAAGFPSDIRNLANPGNNIRMNLFLLKQALKAGARPKLVILNLNPALFTQRSWESEELFKHSYIGQCDYGNPTGFTARVDCGLQKNFFLFRYRGYLKNMATGFFTTITKADKNAMKNLWGDKPHVYSDVSPAGWGPGYRIQSEKDLTSHERRRTADKTRKETTPGDVAARQDDSADGNDAVRWDDSAFRELRTYCRERKIPLLLIWFPAFRNPSLTEGKGDETADRFAGLADRRTTFFINLRNRRLSAENYYDNTHVNVLGAIRLTGELAGILQGSPYRDFLQGKPQKSRRGSKP